MTGKKLNWAKLNIKRRARVHGTELYAVASRDRMTNERMFNRMYRRWRLQAQAQGRPFPSYQQARDRLKQVMLQIDREAPGALVRAAEFWGEVFRTK